MYLANVDQWQDVGRAHGEVFGTVRPATTMVEVKRLIDPDMLVEIEADAIISQGQEHGFSDGPTDTGNQASVQGGSGHEAINP